MSPGIPSFPVIPAWVETGGEKDQGGKRKDRWRRRVRHAKKGMGRGEDGGKGGGNGGGSHMVEQSVSDHTHHNYAR